MKPIISIIMPVYCTLNEILSSSLESAITQTFEDIEIIVVDDSPVDNSCEAIIKPFEERDNRILYISHKGNLGTLEARRTGVISARGDYILFLDADDELEYNACEIMYNAAKKNKADIVNCGANINGIENIPERKHKWLLACEEGFSLGLLINDDIMKNCFFHGKHSNVLWSKLISANLCREAYSVIPQVYCVITEDMLLYFFVVHFAKRYFGIPEKLYHYNIDNGITVERKQYSLEDWQRMCSNSNVYKIIFSWLKEHSEYFYLEPPFMRAMFNAIRLGLQRIKENIAIEIQPQAYNIFCEMWGSDLVKRVEKKMVVQDKKTE